MGIKVKLYHYSKLEADADEAIITFTKRRGYRPSILVIRPDAVTQKLRKVLAKHGMLLGTLGCVTPSHFYLMPVVDKREPVILKGERSAVSNG